MVTEPHRSMPLPLIRTPNFDSIHTKFSHAMPDTIVLACVRKQQLPCEKSGKLYGGYNHNNHNNLPNEENTTGAHGLATGHDTLASVATGVRPVAAHDSDTTGDVVDDNKPGRFHLNAVLVNTALTELEELKAGGEVASGLTSSDFANGMKKFRVRGC